MSSFEQAIIESFEAYMRAVSEKFEIPYDALHALWKGGVKTEGKAKVKKSVDKTVNKGETGCQKKLERGANKGQPCSKPTKNGAKYCSRHAEKEVDDDAKSVVSSTSSKIKRVGSSAKKEVPQPPPVSDSDADDEAPVVAKKEAVQSSKEASPKVLAKSPVVAKKEASPKVVPKKVLPPPELADVSTDEDDD